MGCVVVDDEIYVEWSGEDFNLLNKLYLVVLKKVLDIFKECNIDNCDIYELSKKQIYNISMELLYIKF